MPKNNRLAQEPQSSRESGAAKKSGSKNTTKKQPLKDYEPPERPLTKLNTRRELLLLISEGGAEIVQDLFERCSKPFFRLTGYQNAYPLSSDAEEYSEAEMFSFDSDRYEMEVENRKAWVKMNDTEENQKSLSDSENLRLDARALRDSLVSWGEHWNLKADWFYEFGHRVFVMYWQEHHKPKKPTRIPSPPLPSSKLAIRTAPPPDLHARADTTKMPASAVIPTLPIRLNSPLKEQASNLGRLSRLSFLILAQDSRLIVPILAQELWNFFGAWQKAAYGISTELESKMIAPEERWENIFRRMPGFLGVTLKSEYVPREQRIIQSPNPPDQVPPIVDLLSHENHVPLRIWYEDKVKIKIQMDLKFSLAKYVPPHIRKKWEKIIFEHSKSELDRYWAEYSEHLKTQGWVEVVKKKELRRHCKWFLLYTAGGKTFEQIAVGQEGKGNKTNIFHRVHEIAGWLEIDSLHKGELGKLKFTWRRQKSTIAK